MSEPTLLSASLKRVNGQSWVTDADVEEAGYVGRLGEIVRVQPLLAGPPKFYELAALMSPQRVGLKTTTEPVWWLVPAEQELSDSDLEAALSSTTGGGE